MIDTQVNAPDNVAGSIDFHKNGLTFEGELSYEEWLSTIKQVIDRGSGYQWQLGDLLNYGEKKPWGEKYKQAEEETGLEPQTLRVIKYVASSIDLLTRINKLSFAHHRVVAPNKPHEQKVLLEKAVTLGLSVKQLLEQKESLLPPKGVQPGQLWKLGRHMLYCGDSASETFISLCKQSEAAFAFADPPYNAGVAEWDTNFTWDHDYLSEVAPIVAVTPGISAIKDFMQINTMSYKWSMAYWINNGMTRGAVGFGNWIYVALFARGSIYKNAQDFVRIDLDEKWDCEPISITGGDRDSLKHKGRKPINLLRHIIGLFTQEDQTVVDPFLGTGTTLIVCEELGRSCIGAELNVEFCEHIIKRWEKETECEAEVMEWS